MPGKGDVGRGRERRSRWSSGLSVKRSSRRVVLVFIVVISGSWSTLEGRVVVGEGVGAASLSLHSVGVVLLLELVDVRGEVSNH